MSDVPLMSGFPSGSALQVTLANWQDPPYNRWAFQHLREVIPTQRIPRGVGPATPLPYGGRPLAPGAVPVQRIEGHSSTVEEVLAETWTDAVVIVHSLIGGECGGTGYRGRVVLVEMLTFEAAPLGRAILARSDTTAMERLAEECGMVSRWRRACDAVEAGLTSPAEVRRVLGFGGR